jgi:hypothetical protein
MEERSELLREREQLQDPWQAKPMMAASEERESKEQKEGEAEAEPTAAERVKKLDERVAEIDAKLLQMGSGPKKLRGITH